MGASNPHGTGQSVTRFCVNNPRTLEERQDLIGKDFECLGCLGNCTRCFETRFLEIRGAFVEGETYEQILKRAKVEPARTLPRKERTPPERGPKDDDQDD